MGLEHMVEDMKKRMIISDLHGEFMDKDVFELTKAYMKDYKPDTLVINGDMLDFYSLSTFDKNPERKYDLQSELTTGREILRDLRKTVGPKCKMVYIEGNHENRLQKYLWRNPELFNLPDLKLDKLLRLSKYNVEFVAVDNDYWRNTNGHYKIGDAIITHGDNRTNGTSVSGYAGYSAKNSMLKMQTSIVLGHVHRLALVKHTTPYGTLTGVEAGCLCQKSGTANWQQGFATFETDDDNKNYNYRIHHIEDNKLRVDGTTYEMK